MTSMSLYGHCLPRPRGCGGPVHDYQFKGDMIKPGSSYKVWKHTGLCQACQDRAAVSASSPPQSTVRYYPPHPEADALNRLLDMQAEEFGKLSEALDLAHQVRDAARAASQRDLEARRAAEQAVVAQICAWLRETADGDEAASEDSSLTGSEVLKRLARDRRSIANQIEAGYWQKLTEDKP